MTDSLEDLSIEETRWLDRLSDGRIHVVPTVIAERLESLGLVEQVPPEAEEIALELDVVSLGTKISDEGMRFLEVEE